jgi:hypothetical protein
MKKLCSLRKLDKLFPVSHNNEYKFMNTKLPIFLTAASLLTVGCLPSDDKGTTTLEFSGQNSSTRAITRTAEATTNLPIIGTAGTEIGQFQLTDAWIVVDEIEFEHEMDEDTEGNDSDEESVEGSEEGSDVDTDSAHEAEFTGPFVINLLTGTSYPELPQIQIETGFYTDIEIELDALLQEDAEGLAELPTEAFDALLGHSIFLAGSYTDVSASMTMPFSITFDSDIEFEFTGSDTTLGFTIDDTGINDLIVAFQLDTWFDYSNLETNPDSISISNLLASASGQISLNEVDHLTLLDVIVENMEESGHYGEDLDDDGELDDDEDDQ